jgi:hypothetical protein
MQDWLIAETRGFIDCEIVKIEARPGHQAQ